jgi:hypothetical protein
VARCLQTRPPDSALTYPPVRRLELLHERLYPYGSSIRRTPTFCNTRVRNALTKIQPNRFSSQQAHAPSVPPFNCRRCRPATDLHKHRRRSWRNREGGSGDNETSTGFCTIAHASETKRGWRTHWSQAVPTSALYQSRMCHYLPISGRLLRGIRNIPIVVCGK